MATIHKLKKDGATIFPATITDAIVHPTTGGTLSEIIKEYNVTELFPTEGIDGGNKYTLAAAVQVLDSHLRTQDKTVGIRVAFEDTEYPSNHRSYMYLGGTMTSTANWYDGVDLGEVKAGAVVGDVGQWVPTTAQAYVDEALAGLTATVNATKDKMVVTTWANLVSLRSNSELKPGVLYRISDYTTATNAYGTQSAAHNFDVIVQALGIAQLSENAKAIMRTGDTYFSNSNLEAWELKYCLANDATRFTWASSSGKGVIYWMKDEFGNEAPFDFKNIKFARYNVTASTVISPLTGNYAGYNDADAPSATTIYPTGISVETSTPIYKYTFSDPDTPNEESADQSMTGAAKGNKIISNGANLPNIIMGGSNNILINCKNLIEIGNSTNSVYHDVDNSWLKGDKSKCKIEHGSNLYFNSDQSNLTLSNGSWITSVNTTSRTYNNVTVLPGIYGSQSGARDIESVLTASITLPQFVGVNSSNVLKGWNLADNAPS